jgi:hypothetical protein
MRKRPAYSDQAGHRARQRVCNLALKTPDAAQYGRHLAIWNRRNTMSAKSVIRLFILPLAIACAVPVFAAEDPTVHQVYLAAEAGKFEEAQAMMDKVLRDHPNSGRAHFVQAELLAKQGRMIEAQPELAKAEQLAPGLPFAKPAAVKNLKALIARSNAATPAAPALNSQAAAPTTYAQPVYREAPAAPGSSIPWGMLLIVAAVIAVIVFAMRSMRSRVAQPYGAASAGAGGYGPAAPGQPYQQYGPGGQPMGAPGSGIGSGIMGGLATGAAVGAGIVAGEALMHHFTDRDRDNSSGNANHINYDTPPAPLPDQSLSDDMGGTDFGVSDGGSWDDGGGSGGGDDWN